MFHHLSRRSLIALAAVLATLVAPASAQQQPAQSELQSWTIPGWTFTPGITVGPMFDSNVAIASPDVNGNTASDTMLQMEPFGQLEFRSARTTFSSGYRGSLHRYFDLNELNSTDHRGFANWRERLNRRVILFATEDYQEVATTDLLQLNDLPFQRLGTRHNAIVGGVEARLSKSMDLDARYENSWVKFEHVDPTDPRTGGIVQGIRSDLTHRFGERLEFGGTYDLRFSNMNQGLRQQTFHEAGALVRYRVGERTTIEGAGGVSHLKDQSVDLSQTGSFVRASLVHRLERATIGGEYSRGYKPSFGFGGASQSDDVSGYVHMPLARSRAYIQEAASWHRGRPFDPLEQERRSSWINSTVGYALQRWLRLEGYWAFSRQDTRLVNGIVDRHMIGAQIVISEPVRIR